MMLWVDLGIAKLSRICCPAPDRSLPARKCQQSLSKQSWQPPDEGCAKQSKRMPLFSDADLVGGREAGIIGGCLNLYGGLLLLFIFTVSAILAIISVAYA